MSHPSGFRWFRPKLRVTDEQVVVHGAYYFVFLLYDAAAARPHIATLCGASGRNVVDVSPPDHLHHRGVWWGHGDVNGVDFYLELPGGEGPPDRGQIVHRDWVEVIDEAPHLGFVEALDWVDHRGETLVAERRRVVLHLADDDQYTVDLDSTYRAETDLTFGDTKESVLPGIRLAEPLTVQGGGRLTNSEGGDGEEETMGVAARWLDASGTRTVPFLGGEVTEGIAVLVHPGNPQYPARFFARAYGPVSPFPGHHFFEDRKLEEGRELRLRHRLVVHRGDAEEADIDGKHRAYAEEEDR